MSETFPTAAETPEIWRHVLSNLETMREHAPEGYEPGRLQGEIRGQQQPAFPHAATVNSKGFFDDVLRRLKAKPTLARVTAMWCTSRRYWPSKVGVHTGER